MRNNNIKRNNSYKLYTVNCDANEINMRASKTLDNFETQSRGSSLFGWRPPRKQVSNNINDDKSFFTCRMVVIRNRCAKRIAKNRRGFDKRNVVFV